MPQVTNQKTEDVPESEALEDEEGHPKDYYAAIPSSEGLAATVKVERTNFEPPSENLSPLSDLVDSANVTEQDDEGARSQWEGDSPDEDFVAIMRAEVIADDGEEEDDS